MTQSQREQVREAVRRVVAAREPERLEELAVVFDDAYGAATEEVDDTGRTWDPGEGLPFDLSFLAGSLVTSAIWITTLLVQQRGAEVEVVKQRLAEVTRDPALVDEAYRALQTLLVVREPAPLPAGIGDLRIFVGWRQSTHEELTFRVDGAGRLADDLGSRVLDLPLADFFARRLAETQRLALGGAADAVSVVLNRGAALFENLLSERLKHLLWEVGEAAEIRSLLIVSEETVVPWELLVYPGHRDHPGLAGRALCERFVVCRWTGGWQPPSRLARGAMGIVRNMQSALPSLESERSSLRCSWGKQLTEDVVCRYAPLMEALRADRFAALHFIGHGQGPLALGESPELFLEDHSLVSADLGGISAWQHTRPLVFLNACQSAQGGRGLTGAEGWAKIFLPLGAGALVAPCWSVADSRATLFATCFYEHLAAGDTLGTAANAARERLREDFPGDPSWLAYAVWGDPGAVLEGATPEVPPPPSFGQVPDLGALPTRSWTNKSEFKSLAEYLATASAEDFRALVCACIQLALTELGVEDTTRRDVDGGLTLFGQGPPYALALQWKVFPFSPTALDSSHADECRQAIDHFRRLRVTAGSYVLAHNLDRRHRGFHERLDALLGPLVSERLVGRAEVVDHQRLLRRSFDAMRARFLRLTQERRLSLHPVEASLAVLGGRPVEQVPVRQSWLKIDQHALVEEARVEEVVRDPAAAALEAAGKDPVLLLGAFGFGKTTALARALLESDPGLQLFYVPAAVLDSEIRGAKDLLVRTIDLDELLKGLPESQRRYLVLLARPVVEYVFKGHDIRSALILDGLDESPFLSHSNALQRLFNSLWEVQVPVVLAMRSEFWERRRGDFETTVGEHGQRTSARVQTVRRLDLLPWGMPQILEYVQRYRQQVNEEAALANLDAFARAARAGELERLYGDLLGTPLLLRFAVETVAAEGLPRERVGRASLVLRGVEMKVRRDLAAPARLGGGRALLATGGPASSVGEVLELSWHAMVCAAVCMVGRHENGEIELLPDCLESTLSGSTPRLAQVADWLDLTLVSLLRTVSRPSFREPGRLAFSHRAFQELFLAWYLELTGQTNDLLLPDTVREWVDDLRSEGLPTVAERRAASSLPPLPGAAPAR